jgi:hypothetical protein
MAGSGSETPPACSPSLGDLGGSPSGLRANGRGDVEDVGADGLQNGLDKAARQPSGPSVFSSAFLSKYPAEFAGMFVRKWR